MLQRLGTLEDAGERVVIARGDGVELVVVAAGAADGLAEEGLAHRVELFVHHIHFELLLLLLFEVRVAEREERRGDELLLTLGDGAVREQIAGDLLAEEAVVGLVRVEAGDDVVAVAPSLLHHEAAQRERLGVTHHVQPVPAPTLAEVRGGEQGIHEPHDRTVLTFPLSRLLTCLGRSRCESGRVRK